MITPYPTLPAEGALLHALALGEATGSGTFHADPVAVDWTAFRGLLMRSKMLPTLFSRVEPLMPGHELQLARAEFGRLHDRASRLLRESQALQRLAEEQELNVIFVKGAPFSQQHYGSPFRRMSMDIDMLVERDRVSQMDSILRSIGYTLPVERYVYPAAESGGAELECPIAVDYPPVGSIYHMLRPDYVKIESGFEYSAEMKYFIRYVDNVNTFKLFTHSVICDLGDVRLRALCLEHGIIHFALDKYKDFSRGAQYRYRDIFDLLILTLRHDDQVWRRVYDAACDLCVVDETFSVLAVPSYTLGIAPASPLLRSMIERAAGGEGRLFDYLSIEGFFSDELTRQNYEARFAPAFVRWAFGRGHAAPPPIPTQAPIQLPRGVDIPLDYEFKRDSQAIEIVINVSNGCFEHLRHLLVHIVVFGAEPISGFTVVVEYKDRVASVVSGGDNGRAMTSLSYDRDRESLAIRLPRSLLPTVSLGGENYLLYSLRVDRAWYKCSNGKRIFSLIAGHDRQIARL